MNLPAVRLRPGSSRPFSSFRVAPACAVPFALLLLLQSICSSLGLHDGAVYDLYTKLRNAPEMQQNNGLEDGTVIVVNASRSPDGHLGSDNRHDEAGGGGGVVGGDSGVTSPPSAFVTTPAAYATSE